MHHHQPALCAQVRLNMMPMMMAYPAVVSPLA